MGDELAEERPRSRDVRVGVAGALDAQIARAAGPAERVPRLLVDAARGQVLEHRAVAPAGERRVDASRRQTVIPGDARGMPAHRPTCPEVARPDGPSVMVVSF